MSENSRMSSRVPPPTLVALAGWLVPGAGYWLLGQKSRALIIGITILCLWVSGLAIGGVRIIEVPKYDLSGQYIPRPHQVAVRQPMGSVREPRYRTEGASLLQEIGRKPWSIAQVLTGPVAIVSGGVSVWASREDPETGEARFPMPHARMWEIPVLYTAVAGMLNLIAIIDAAYRARHQEGRR